MRKLHALLLVALFLTSSLFAIGNPVSGAPTQGNTWATKAPMQVARSDLGVAVVNGKIYAIGGNTESGYIPNSGGNNYQRLGWINDTNEEYDPETDMWAFKASMPTARCNFAIAAFKNKIYCIGGVTNWNSESSYTGVNEVYDPATDIWETKAPMPNPVSATATVVNGRIYVIGGGGANKTLNQVYDPATNTWTIKTPMPDGLVLGGGPNTMSNFLSANINDKIYVMRYYNPYHTSDPSGTWIYNPANDSWASLPANDSWASPYPSPFPILSKPYPYPFSDPITGWWSHAAGATTGVNALKRIYVFFDRYPYSPSIPLLAFDPSNYGWAKISEVPTTRRSFGVAVVNDVLYTIGGRTYDYPYPDDNYFTVTEQAVNEQYTPLGYGTPDPTYDGTPPEIAVLSPENITYHTVDVVLNFTVNETASSMRYMLDGENFQIFGNITLTELPYGSHNLTVYATDAADNTGSSETVNFIVAKEPEPFPVVPVVVASVIVVLVGGGLLLYLRKRQQKAMQP